MKSIENMVISFLNASTQIPSEKDRRPQLTKEANAWFYDNHLRLNSVQIKLYAFLQREKKEKVWTSFSDKVARFRTVLNGP